GDLHAGAMETEQARAAALASAAVEVSVYLGACVGEYSGPIETQCERLLELVAELERVARALAPASPASPAPATRPVPAAPRPAAVLSPAPVAAPPREKARFNVLCVSKHH